MPTFSARIKASNSLERKHINLRFRTAIRSPHDFFLTAGVQHSILETRRPHISQ